MRKRKEKSDFFLGQPQKKRKNGTLLSGHKKKKPLSLFL